eukprot:2173766-Rhodomonas_salina.5
MRPGRGSGSDAATPGVTPAAPRAEAAQAEPASEPQPQGHAVTVGNRLPPSPDSESESDSASRNRTPTMISEPGPESLRLRRRHPVAVTPGLALARRDD